MDDFTTQSADADEHHESEDQVQIEKRAASAATVITAEQAAPPPKTPEGRSLTSSVEIAPYKWAVGGWGSVRSVSAILHREKVPSAGRVCASEAE